MSVETPLTSDAVAIAARRVDELIDGLELPADRDAALRLAIADLATAVEAVELIEATRDD